MERFPAHLIRRVHQLSTAIFAEELADLDLTALQYAALVAIAEMPTADTTRVADAIGTDKATLGSVISRLEAKKLVKRVQSKADRRVRILTNTPAGTLVLHDAEARVRHVQARLTEALSADQRTAFVAAMRAILAA